jgi:hypothetical protein
VKFAKPIKSCLDLRLRSPVAAVVIVVPPVMVVVSVVASPRVVLPSTCSVPVSVRDETFEAWPERRTVPDASGRVIVRLAVGSVTEIEVVTPLTVLPSNTSASVPFIVAASKSRMPVMVVTSLAPLPRFVLSENVVVPFTVLVPVTLPIVLAAPAPVPKVFVVLAPVAIVELPVEVSVVNELERST